MIAPEDVKYLVWQPYKATWRPPKQISEEQRLERELELIQYRQREREEWELEKVRLGLGVIEEADG